MFTHHRLVCVLLISMLTGACATQRNGVVDCATIPEKPPHKLKFKLKTDGCVEKVVKDDDEDCDCDAEAVVVRHCDTIEWKVSGKEKTVEFEKGDGTPFEWRSKSDKQKIVGQVVVNPTVKTPYAYSVLTEGKCALDPMIIVQP